MISRTRFTVIWSLWIAACLTFWGAVAYLILTVAT